MELLLKKNWRGLEEAVTTVLVTKQVRTPGVEREGRRQMTHEKSRWGRWGPQGGRHESPFILRQ